MIGFGKITVHACKSVFELKCWQPGFKIDVKQFMKIRVL